MNDSELLNIFYIEVNEYLEALNNALLQVEMIAPSEAAYTAQVREMNRVAHSMKGAARAVGLSLIETIAHHMEEVFAAVQREELALTPDAADTLYDSLDLIQNAVDGEENNPDALTLVLANLEALMEGEPLQSGDVTSDSRQMAIVHVVEDVAAQDALLIEGDGQIEKEVIPPIKADKKTSTHSRPTVIAPKMTQATATGQFTAVPVTDGGTMILRPAEETVRVTVNKLDQLMAEATELFVARLHGEEQGRSIAEVRRVHRRWQREWRTVRAAYIRLARRLQDEQQAISPELPILLKFLDTNQRYLLEMNRQLSSLAQSVGNYNMHLSALTDQLQDDISAMRMMPFESIAGGFQRMVRDLARDLDKQLQMEVIGAGVEIDKTVLEALKDPIMHLLRNAVDHAIETPEQRMRAGKSPVGRIEIGVEQRGSEIVLRVTDDGRGIDPERVRQSIVKSHLLTESEAGALSDDDARMYIFQSGLTTSDQVTALSGRGLGMD
ncbi:MAG: Hpt domain-containing protein, partial [Chitinophagaceae bacterium]|nr:Hpt domain-containing protein [Anaerolineae bacterium]